MAASRARSRGVVKTVRVAATGVPAEIVEHVAQSSCYVGANSRSVPAGHWKFVRYMYYTSSTCTAAKPRSSDVCVRQAAISQHTQQSWLSKPCWATCHGVASLEQICHPNQKHYAPAGTRELHCTACSPLAHNMSAEQHLAHLPHANGVVGV